MRLTFLLAPLALVLVSAAALAQAPGPHPPDPSSAEAQRAGQRGDAPPPLPPDAVSHQTLELPGRTLHFTATAGTIHVVNDRGAGQADVTFVAFQQEDADHRTRPVTFVFNGGPGMASGWLDVGAVGPWRVELTTPSGPSDPQPNAETWLDFTDLVFIDPPDTGYSRVVTTNEDARRRIFSVAGDVDLLAETVRRWLDRADRNTSPKYLLGESYGGFRGPRLARRLESQQGVGLSGMVLLSPLLDTNVESGFANPFSVVDRLPSIVAAARAKHGPVTRADLADVERYAATDYLADFLRGLGDHAAVDRMSERVAALTGLDPALVRRYRGRLDIDVALHELDRADLRVGSVYDATITSADPFPDQPLSNYPDPVLEGFKPVVTMAMMTIYHRIGWQPEAVYHLSDDGVFERWDWGSGMDRPQSVSQLQAALALDPRLKVLIAHGLFDLRTPYFTNLRLIRQLADLGGGQRLKLVAYPGGHMFYSDQASRAALHEDARALLGQ
jgi:carboxypeptidase C (cathepsin A)